MKCCLNLLNPTLVPQSELIFNKPPSLSALETLVPVSELWYLVTWFTFSICVKKKVQKHSELISDFLSLHCHTDVALMFEKQSSVAIQR